MASAYVRFALRQPQLFKLIFRNDLAELARGPDVKGKAARCFDAVMSALKGPANTSDTHRQRDNAIAAWSMAHGVSTLPIRGIIGGTVRNRPDQREAIADRTIAHFVRLL